MKRVTFVCFLLGVLTLVSLNLLAQGSGQVTRPPGGYSNLVTRRVAIPTISDAPFTATLRIEWVRRLEDGSILTWRSHQLVARDSRGRTFQEFRSFSSDGDTRENRLYELKFSNPATHEMYVCDGQGQTCHLSHYYEPPPEEVLPVQENINGVTRVYLGKLTISGVETEGSKETTIISTAEAASDRPITTTKEFWYSHQLRLNVVLKRYDPRVGAQNFLFDNLIIGEPNPSLFEVPAGATILRDKVAPPEEP